MTTRLPQGGRLIDRRRPLAFRFNGQQLQGFAGDTLGAALLGAGQSLLGRSFKYHRPRGLMAAGPEEPNALMRIGTGAKARPNLRASEVALHEGLVAESQNHWPSLEYDAGAILGLASPLFSAGFYYKTFLWPRAFWKHVYEPVIRRLSGLGRPPEGPDGARYEQRYGYCDLLIAGGGVAGLAAAEAAGAAGLRVIVAERGAYWGGRALVDQPKAGAEIAARLQRLAAMPNVTLRLHTEVAAVYDHGYALAVERAPEFGEDGSPAERLWRLRATRVLAATGAIERPLAFAGNDRPGVMLASAMRDYLDLYAVSPGDRTVLMVSHDEAYLTAFALKAAGLEVPAILDARPAPDGALVQRAEAMGLRVLKGRAIGEVKGRGRVEAVTVCTAVGEGAPLETIPCEAVANSGGWNPVVHLYSQPGGKLIWDEGQAHFRPDPSRPPLSHDGAPLVFAAGAAHGVLAEEAVAADGERAVADILALAAPKGAKAGRKAAPAAPVTENPGIWLVPAGAALRLRRKMWLDFQNDVKVSDLELAAREGFTSVEHAKRYTTLGMATDQGKLSNIGGLAVLAGALARPIPEVGTTTFRPPFTPVTIGALAGEARGDLFQPLRQSPMQAWHEAQGAVMEPVGLWRRPYSFPHAGETREAAAAREVLEVRQNVALLDASTLGKLLVSGPDAGRFLDMLYTGMMSNLPIGKCRYGLMCNEQGFLIDDGVVVRLSETEFLCHTTTGGAERIHAWMEDWLQCEWVDWQVFTANLTEQFAQVAIAGPKARALLQKLGGMDLSPEALPFMSFASGTLGGFAARLFRISFSGELAYEVAVPASQGLAFWEAALAAGAEWGAGPYGTEALHILRAEKGYIMMGDETDGTVTPLDLGLDWAVSKKKADFLGKRGLMRPYLQHPERWRLVGLETLDGSVLPDGALARSGAKTANGQEEAEGRVTSTYFSPTLQRGIAMGLVRRGPERLGEVLHFTGPLDGGPDIPVRLVPPIFYDEKGERLHG